MIKVVVCGYMTRFPLAGMMLAYFHYVLGLKRLGHEVVYLETSGWPQSCFDPESGTWGEDPRTGLRAVHDLFARHSLDVSVLYIDQERDIVFNAEREDVRAAVAAADLVLNLGGVNDLPEFELCGRHVLVDMDPFFTQVGRFGHAHLGSYTSCFSYGLNLGKPGCSIPTLGIDWVPTRPPVVMDIWDFPPPEPDAPFSTVASWGAYGDIEHEGTSYGQKDREFMRVLELPSCTGTPLVLALSGASAEVRGLLERNGWHLRDAGEVTRSLRNYRSHIAGSKAEFSVAKHAYVATRSGWFSDRTVCYLASGRPAVLQDTGFSDSIASGTGVVAFTTLNQAVAGIEEVSRNYEKHSASARALAQEFFSHEVVLPRLIERALS
jgi:hypothetical protein